jgi:putative ABC transport system permease protein
MSVQQLEPEIAECVVSVKPTGTVARPPQMSLRIARQLQFGIDVMRQVLRTLGAHKLRAMLTMFGIAWGVASLLLLVGMGEGFRSRNRRELDELGRDIMFLFPARAPAVEGSLRSGRFYMLTYQDYLDASRAPYVRVATPVLARDDVRAVSEFASGNGEITGVEPQYQDLRFLPIEQGRWLNRADEEQKRNVVVLGDELKKHLFPGQPALDGRVILNGIPFTVIGTLKRVGHGDNNSTNMRAYVPFRVMAMYFPIKGENREGAISFLNYSPRTRDEHALAELEVHKVVARNHGFDYHDKNAFDGWDTIQQSKLIGKLLDLMDTFLGSVGLITLALGAIGVVNIMLVSVSERTPEIGLRKAVGATKRSVLLQFFLEGLAITSFSGIVGILGAMGLISVLERVAANAEGFDPPRIVPTSAILAIGSLTLAAVAAGLYPAYKAANLEPVEALRREQ